MNFLNLNCSSIVKWMSAVACVMIKFMFRWHFFISGGAPRPYSPYSYTDWGFFLSFFFHNCGLPFIGLVTALLCIVLISNTPTVNPSLKCALSLGSIYFSCLHTFMSFYHNTRYIRVSNVKFELLVVVYNPEWSL